MFDHSLPAQNRRYGLIIEETRVKLHSLTGHDENAAARVSRRCRHGRIS
jgi:hypothetical protein